MAAGNRPSGETEVTPTPRRRSRLTGSPLARTKGSPLARTKGSPLARAKGSPLARAKGPLLALATVAATLGAGELVARLTGDRQAAFESGLNRTHRRWAALVQSGFYQSIDDPVRRYAMRPGAEFELDGWTFRASGARTRGADVALPKPPDERRILAIGDSFCFGLWCDEDETVVGRLAALANQAEQAAGGSTHWRAINCGVPGYHTGQQYLALIQDGLALEPDLVLLYFNSNDILADGFFYDDELHALYSDAMPFPSRWRRRLWASHLYGWIERHRERALTAGPSPHLSETSPWSHNRPVNRQATAAALAAIADACRTAHVPLFAIHQPLMSWTGDARSADWEILPLVEWAEARFDELEIAHLNLLGWMRGNRDGVDRGPEGTAPPPEFLLEPYFADEDVQGYLAAMDRGEAPAEVALPADPDFHLTAEGYAELARLAYPLIQARGWLP
jgi:lysophospholipase L1-like esterase